MNKKVSLQGLAELQTPLLIAHRGDKTHYPENTLASFEAALEAGAEMIELDITLSRDREMVVIHDDTLERTTNGEGDVGEHSLAELKKLDAGSWFDKQFAGEQIPTLSEVLEQVNRRAIVNIEIKKSAFENPAPDDAIEIQLMSLIQEMDLADFVIISSFEERLLQRISAANPSLALGVISLEEMNGNTIGMLKEMGAYSWHGWYATMTADQVKQMHDNGFRVFSFTVNEMEVFEQLTGMGIDGVFTDDCPLFRNRP